CRFGVTRVRIVDRAVMRIATKSCALATAERLFAVRVIGLSGPAHHSGPTMDEPTARNHYRGTFRKQDFGGKTCRHVPCRCREAVHRRRQTMRIAFLVVPCAIIGAVSGCGPLGGTTGTAGELGNGVFQYDCAGPSDPACDAGPGPIPVPKGIAV